MKWNSTNRSTRHNGPPRPQRRPIERVQPSSTGQDLLDVAIKHLNLLETSYFGLRYLEPACKPSQSRAAAAGHQAPPEASHNNKQQVVWLDMKRNAIKQLRDSQPMTVYFGVKYYASDPCKLAEEITRYQFFLQCKQDILHSRLPVSFELAVELFALAVQSELGDFDPQRHQADYISEFAFLQNQTSELERHVATLHRKLAGQVPATAELNFLERVKYLDLYGCELHPIQYNEDEREEYALGLNPSGVLVLRNRIKVAQYQWPRVSKTKCQGRCFLMDVIEIKQPQNHQQQPQHQVAPQQRHRFGFRLADKKAAQRLRWSFEDHKSFQFLIRNSANSSQLASRTQPLNFGQKFRHSIRSAIGVGGMRPAHLSGAYSSGGPGTLLTQEAHEQERAQRLGSSLKRSHQQHYESRAPPTVVRMPSRRLSNRAAAQLRPAAASSQLNSHHSYYHRSDANGNGLPAMQAANHGGANTMVESQRQRALMMMMHQFRSGQAARMSQHQARNDNHDQHLQYEQQLKSQTLRPVSKESKVKNNAAYMERLMEMSNHKAALMMQQQQRADVAVLPPGRHIIHKPTIYKSTSVINGLDQLATHAKGQVASNRVIHYPASAGHAEFASLGRHEQLSTGLQLFNGQPVPMGQYHSAGHESPRSTKSAIAVSSAIKLANKKLIKQQQQHQQQQLIYHNNASQQTPLLLAYENPGPMSGYYAAGYNAAALQANNSSSANVSPRSVRSARLSGHHRSKSTNENLHLLHNNEKHQQSSQLNSRSTYAENKAALLLSTVASHQLSGNSSLLLPPPPPPSYVMEAKYPIGKQHNTKFPVAPPTSAESHNLQRREPIKSHRKGPDCQSEEEEYCCSRSDCSSLVAPNDQMTNQLNESQRSALMMKAKVARESEQSQWNAIRRRHNDFSQGKGFLNREANKLSYDLNNNHKANRTQGYDDEAEDADEQQQLVCVKNIANKQATPILLTMNNSDHSPDSMCNSNNKAVQLLNLQRQQLQHHDSMIMSGGEGADPGPRQSNPAEATSGRPSSGAVARSDESASVSPAASSASSSPKSSGDQSCGPKLATNSRAKQLLLKQHKAESGANSTCGSANSATSGYYGGSQNSTGSVSLDSDNQCRAGSDRSSNWSDEHRARVQSGNGCSASGTGQVPLGSLINRASPLKATYDSNNHSPSGRVAPVKPMMYNNIDANHPNQDMKKSLENRGGVQNHRYLLDHEPTANDFERNAQSSKQQQKQNSNIPRHIQYHQQQAAPPSLKYVSFDV